METVYGTLSVAGGVETIEEWTCESEARMCFERICSSGECEEVQLVELEGAGPFYASDGTEIAPTHAPRRTIEEWSAKVRWQDLEVYGEDGRSAVSAERRIEGLVEFRRTGGMLGLFFAQGERQDPDRPDEWGPQSAEDVDWTGFVDAVIAAREEVL